MIYPVGLGVVMADWSAKNPFMTTISDNFVLNGEGSRCPTDLVDELLTKLNFSGNEDVETHLGDCTIREALTDRYEIHRVSKKWIEGLSNRSSKQSGPVDMKIVRRQRFSSNDGSLIVDWKNDSGQGEVPEGYVEIGTIGDNSAILLKELISDKSSMEDYIWSRDYVDAISDFSNMGFTPQQLIDGMDRLKPRLYSIASSPEFEKGTVHLTVAIVRYNHHERDRTGLCTGYMADECKTGKTDVGVFMSPTRSFVLPEDGSKDIIMVGPGTGIAPFRAFLQQREIDKSEVRNWLFFGDWTSKGEYLYEEEMEEWKQRGVITKHDLAWSREGEEKVYVQHLMKKNGEEIWNWIENGAYFYVCGDKQYMAKDVHQTLIDICSEYGGMILAYLQKIIENNESRGIQGICRDRTHENREKVPQGRILTRRFTHTEVHLA